MAAKDLKRATENLACPVCYQVFRNPKYLPCYHSYCEECLEKMQKQSKIICPECRKETVVPAGGVKELPNNFFINRLVDEFILKRKVEGQEDVKCDKCDEDDPVVSYCPDCSLFLCQVCNEAHKRDRSSRGHSIVPLTELQSNKDVPIQAKVKAQFCKDHDYELKHYCETCEQLVCLYCTMKEHSNHSHDTVNKMAIKHQKELQKITAPVEEMIESLSEAHNSIDKMKMKIRQQGDAVDKQIDYQYDELIQRLLVQKEQLKQQAHNAVSQKEKALTVQLEEVEYTQTELLSMKELKVALEKSSDQEVLSVKKQVIGRMQQIANKYYKLNVHPSQSATMEFISTRESLPQFGKLLTHVDPYTSEVKSHPNHITVGQNVEFVIITKYGNGSQCSIGGSQVSVQLKSDTGEVTSVQVRDNNDGSYMASCVPQIPGQVNLFAYISGQEIKGSPYHFTVLHKKIDYTTLAADKPSKIVNNNGNMRRPYGISFSKNGMWAVVDQRKHCVYIYDNKDQLIKSFGSQEQIKNPIGIAFDDDNHIYVTCFNKLVKKFDFDGTYLLQLDSQRAGLRNPMGITVHNNKVYTADYLCNCIVVFQTNGQFCHTIGNGQIRYPYDVTVSTNNRLLVAGWVDSCIYSFTLDGTYIGKFGERGSSRGLLQCPSSLTTDSNGCILVAENANNRVSIFDKTGKLVNCFGSEGQKNGQLQSPNGIAISPNGNIYVCDSDNNRIQIFSD